MIRPAPRNAADIQTAEEILQMNIVNTTRGEVRKAIKTLKNGKVGSDGVPADISTSTDMLYEISEEIGDEEEIPEEWKEGYLEILGNAKTTQELCISRNHGRC